MHYRFLDAAAMAAVLACATAIAIAADDKPQSSAEQPAKSQTPEKATKAKPTEKAAKAQPADKGAKGKAAKPAPQLVVDLNTAGKGDLKKLPGVDDALADKIVAGRPYRSKADLVTRNIIPTGTYEQLKRNVIAKPK